VISSQDAFFSEFSRLKTDKHPMWFSFFFNGVAFKGWAAVERVTEDSIRLFTGGPTVLIMWDIFKPLKFEIFEPGDILAEQTVEALARGKRFWRVTISTPGTVLLFGEGMPDEATGKILCLSKKNVN